MRVFPKTSLRVRNTRTPGNRAKTAFVSVTQNFTTADSIGKLTLNLLMSFAEFEREMIAERTRDKIAAARRRGKWTGGTVPLGYEVHDHKLVVNHVEAVLVQEIFDLYLAHRSALTVARILNDRKHTTKRHRAGNGNLRGARTWAKDGVLRVLRNPVYAGLISNGDERHEGEHTGIVDPDLYQRVQDLLDSRPMTSWDAARNPAFFLRGVLRCGACGAAMVPVSNRRKGKVYRYYRCSTRDKLGASACTTKPLPANAIEEFVVERIREAVREDGLAEHVAREMRDRIQIRRGDLEKLRAGLPAEVDRLRVEASTLAEKVASVEGTARDLLGRRLNEATEALTKKQAFLAEVRKSLTLLAQTEVDAEWVAGALADFDKVWDIMTPENRIRLSHALVECVTVSGANHSVEVTLAQLRLPPLPSMDCFATRQRRGRHA